MSATTAIEVGSDLWNARLFAGLALASELTASLKRPSRVASSSIAERKNLRQLEELNRSVDDMLATFDRAIEQQQLDSVPSSAPTIEDYRSARDFVLRLHALCASVLVLQEGVRTSPRVQSGIAQLQANAERLLDLADWLDAMSMPEEIEARFSALEEDMAKGDVVPWSAVQ
jgi:hypothetical protein